MFACYDMSSSPSRTTEIVSPPVAFDVPAILGGTPIRPAGPPEGRSRPSSSKPLSARPWLTAPGESTTVHMSPDCPVSGRVSPDRARLPVLERDGAWSWPSAVWGRSRRRGDPAWRRTTTRRTFRMCLRWARPRSARRCPDNWNFDPARIVESLSAMKLSSLISWGDRRSCRGARRSPDSSTETFDNARGIEVPVVPGRRRSDRSAHP